MAQIMFTTENKAKTSGLDFPKLRLEKKGDVARVVCLENPEMAWVHDLRAPKILNGRPVMEEKKRKDGSTYEVRETDYIGSPLCTGSSAILSERGSDPTNCIVCAFADENSDGAKPPQRKFAMHVIQYQTKNSSSTEVTLPIQVAVKVWKFTDKVFSTLVDIAQEHGNLQEKDISLKLAGDVSFQQYEISPLAHAAWRSSEAVAALVAEVFKSNKSENLLAFCGKETEEKWVRDDLEKIRNRWAIVARAEAGGATQQPPEWFQASENPAQSLTAGLDGLLDGIDDTIKEPTPPVQEKTPISLEDLLG